MAEHLHSMHDAPVVQGFTPRLSGAGAAHSRQLGYGGCVRLSIFMLLANLLMHSTASAQAPRIIKVNPLRDAYYGDLHLHTSYSFDAYLNGTGIDPDQAYRFAKGEVVRYLGE